MRLRNLLLLSGLCIVSGLTMGGGCQGNTGNPDDLLDLSVSRGTLFYWGHSTFSITSASGQVLLIDPYDPQYIGYPRHNVAPSLVLMTHNHWDHSDTSWWANNPTIVSAVDDSGTVTAIDESYGPFHVRTVGSLHGAAAGEEAEGNAILVIDVDGTRIVHMGDFGQASLDEGQLAAIGPVDFLLIPVGGHTWTMDGAAACTVVGQLDVRYVLPMHFQTNASNGGELAGQLDTVDAFVECFPYDPVRNSTNGITLNNAALVTQPTLLLLDYE